jgi:ribosome-binding protein aMBF1 (putative translation factor)
VRWTGGHAAWRRSWRTSRAPPEDGDSELVAVSRVLESWSEALRPDRRHSGFQVSVDFGGLLRAYRERALLSQERLAERSGLSARVIRDLETGRVRRPHASRCGC